VSAEPGAGAAGNSAIKALPKNPSSMINSNGMVASSVDLC